MSSKRSRELVDARKTTFYLLRKYAGYGPTQTARLLKKDHSTVIHHLETFEGQIMVNKAIRAQLAVVDKRIEQRLRSKNAA